MATHLPTKFHGQRSLAGYSIWGHQELDTTGRTSLFRVRLKRQSISLWDVMDEKGEQIREEKSRESSRREKSKWMASKVQD